MKWHNMVHTLSSKYFYCSKGNSFLLSLQLVLCRVATFKSSPVHRPWCSLYATFQPMETVLRKTRESTGVNCRNVRRRVRCQ